MNNNHHLMLGWLGQIKPQKTGIDILREYSIVVKPKPEPEPEPKPEPKSGSSSIADLIAKATEISKKAAAEEYERNQRMEQIKKERERRRDQGLG